jgi:hypothetical protein
MTQVASHVVHCAQQLPQIHYGVSMLTTVISSVVTLGMGFGLGWYVKGRGLTGVQNDLNNVKTDVANIKAQISPTPAVATATPAA